MTGLPVSEKAKDLFQRSHVVDLQLFFEAGFEVPYYGKWEALTRFRDAHVTYLCIAVAMDGTSMERAIRFIADVTGHIQAHSDHYILTRTAKDIQQAKKENKLAIGFQLHGSNPIEKNLNMVDVYYQLGVRNMILVHNIRNPFGEGIIESPDIGLSRLGKRLIKKMNETGMLIDCTHTGYRTSMETMALTEAPIVFSHSNANAVHAHMHNLKDDQIKALAKTGGIIGVNGDCGFLGTETNVPQKFVEHVDYISQLIGPQHISIGIDLLIYPDIFYGDYVPRNIAFYMSDYGKGSVAHAEGLQPEGLVEVVELLLQRNYSEADIRGIMGDNFIRVASQVWK